MQAPAILKWAVPGICALMLTAPAAADSWKDESNGRGDRERMYEFHERGDRHGRKHRHDDDRRRRDRDWYHGHVHIPPGHLPPPGSCRIWYPDRPPGHQPPPGNCRELSWHVPPGAILVR